MCEDDLNQTVVETITLANQQLTEMSSGSARVETAEGSDPRWECVMDVAGYLEDHPDEVWEFASRWGQADDKDLNTAIGTVILEHLLEHHFVRIFPRIEELVAISRPFARTFQSCWAFGQTEQPENLCRFEELKLRTK